MKKSPPTIGFSSWHGILIFRITRDSYLSYRVVIYEIAIEFPTLLTDWPNLRVSGTTRLSNYSSKPKLSTCEPTFIKQTAFPICSPTGRPLISKSICEVQFIVLIDLIQCSFPCQALCPHSPHCSPTLQLLPSGLSALRPPSGSEAPNFQARLTG